MDKEIKDLLDKLIEKLGDSLNKECEIHVIKDKNGKAEVNIKGNRIDLLITLAGLKEELLNRLDCSEEMFKAIESMTGVKEVN